MADQTCGDELNALETRTTRFDLAQRAEAAEARVVELEAAVEEALRELGSATLANSPAVRATTALLRVVLKGKRND